MKSVLAILSLAATAIASALPAIDADGNSIFRRATPDGTCGRQNSGANKGYTCSGTLRCCSVWGWCGSSAEHCGSGCQPGFGSCGGTTTPPPPPASNRPLVGNVPYGQTIYNCRVPGIAALTFDDGPYAWTNELLDLLARNGVRATFFINGDNWGPDFTNPYSGKPPLIQRMIRDGHQIGSHTWGHPSMNGLSVANQRLQLTALEGVLLQHIGRYPTYFRAPFFECDGTCQATAGSLGYHVIQANVDTLDWQYNTPQTIQTSINIFNNAARSTNPATGSLLTLMHDVHHTTVTHLVQQAINTFKARGFRAGTVGECMGDPAANWYRTRQ